MGDRIAVMKKGRIIACGTLKELKKGINLDVYEITVAGLKADMLEAFLARLREKLGEKNLVRLISYRDGKARIKIARSNLGAIDKTISLVLRGEQKLVEIKEREVSLGEVFFVRAGGFNEL